MTTTIHYVRHGVYTNPEGRVPGRIPGFHLTPEGEKGIEKVGAYFKGRKIKYIFTSPLERTYETANIIGKYLPSAKIIHSYDLIEADATHWQAYKYEELFTNNYYEAYINDPKTDKVTENLEDLAKRMTDFTLKLCEKHKGEEIICVSHEYPIVSLVLTLEEKPLQLLKTYQVAMGSITTFMFDENCHLTGTTYTELK